MRKRNHKVANQPKSTKIHYRLTRRRIIDMINPEHPSYSETAERLNKIMKETGQTHLIFVQYKDHNGKVFTSDVAEVAPRELRNTVTMLLQDITYMM